MVKKCLLALAIFVSITPCFAFAQRDALLEVEGRYWFTDMEGKINVTENDLGTDIDFKEDLDIKDEGYPEVRLTWYTGKNSRIRAAYTQVEYEGDTDLKRTIEFNGETYLVGTRVFSEADIRYLRIGWAWQFINIGKGFLKLGPLVEGIGFWVEGFLEAPNLSPPIRESEEFWFGLPTVGMALNVRPHSMLDIFAEGSGMYAGSYGYVYDCEAGIKLIPIKILSLLGGYRILDFKAEHDPDYIRVKVHGPFVGVTVRF
jgi:hypothetical protein